MEKWQLSHVWQTVNLTLSHVWMELNNAGLHGEKLHLVKPTEGALSHPRYPDVVTAIPCSPRVW